MNVRVSYSLKTIVLKTAQQCCMTTNDWIESIIWQVVEQGGIAHPTFIQADDVRAMLEPADEQLGFFLDKGTVAECERMAKQMGITISGFILLAILVDVADFDHYEVTLEKRKTRGKPPLGRKVHRYKYIDVIYKALERAIRKEEKAARK